MKIAKHRAIMSKILLAMFKNNKLADKLGFKGGTACYFFHDLPRFSVDLDLNLINPETVNIDEFSKNVTEVLKNFGEITQFYNKRNTLFWLINYEKQAWNLKVEISTRDYQDGYEIKQFLGANMKIMQKDYIFSHKLVALTDRNNPVGRDVFDINFFLEKNWKLNKRIIEERKSQTATDYISSLSDFINDNFTNKNILDGVGELLTESQRDHYRTKLLEEAQLNLSWLNENLAEYLV